MSLAPVLISENKFLTALTRDIQCEKFIEDESVSHESCDSMYPNISKNTETVLRQIRKTTKNHPLDVAKKYVETYSSSDAAAQNPEDRAFYI